MSWFSKWLNSDSVKIIVKLGSQILKAIGVSVADDLMKIAREEVALAQVSGRSSAEKYEMVMAALKKKLPDVKEHAANLAIELALAALKARG